MAVNRVGGSGLQQAAMFAVASAFLVGAGAAAHGEGSQGLRLRAADRRRRSLRVGDAVLGEFGVHWSQGNHGYGPYVAREADGGQAVSGSVLADWTRTLAEAARRHLGRPAPPGQGAT